MLLVSLTVIFSYFNSFHQINKRFYRVKCAFAYSYSEYTSVGREGINKKLQKCLVWFRSLRELLGCTFIRYEDTMLCHNLDDVYYYS